MSTSTTTPQGFVSLGTLCLAQPITDYHIFAIAATTHLAHNGDGKDTWISPIVDSRKGRLRSSAGRMGTGRGDENEGVMEDPYAQ